MVNVKQLEARNALDSVLLQYKLEQSLHEEYLTEMFQHLGKRLEHIQQQQQERRDSWGEEEVEKLRAAWHADAKRLLAESQARVRELVTIADKAVPAEQMQ
jgi:hypothetical protein